MQSLFDRLETLTVSQLTAQIKGRLEGGFPNVWVTGEISSWKKYPGSGHVYLTLKDAGAVLSCVIWRSTAARLRDELGPGMAVQARGRVSVFPEQGKYQLYIEQIEPFGAGAHDL